MVISREIGTSGVCACVLVGVCVSQYLLVCMGQVSRSSELHLCGHSVQGE